MNKKLKLIVILMALSVLSLHFIPSRADSGWDSDYDSGSSWDSGSDWDSGSSWDNDYDSWDSDYKGSTGGHLYGSGNNSFDKMFELFAYAIAIIIIVKVIQIANGKTENFTKQEFRQVPKRGQYYKSVSDELLQKYGINKEEFLREIFTKYVTIQNAWSDFDYNTLKDNLTNELYNSYIMQLDALKLKNQKNVMSDIKYLDGKIVYIKEENGLINVECYLNIEMYDYVVDSTNNVIRGDKNHKIDIEYTITFVKRIDSKIIKCPKCGAELDTIVSGVCSYCRAKVTVDAKDYVMSKKTNIGQRWK